MGWGAPTVAGPTGSKPEAPTGCGTTVRMIERGRSNWPGEGRWFVCAARAVPPRGPLGGVPWSRTKPAASSDGAALEVVTGCALAATGVAVVADVGDVPAAGVEELDGTDGGDAGG